MTDSEGKQVYPIAASQWKAGNPAYDSLHNNWDKTFEFRYSHPDITDDEEAANIRVFNEMYKWMITSSDEAFVAELGNWFIEDAALYMYLFTERYTMLDNRAKNTFWHWGKVYISDAEARAMGEEKAAWFTLDNEKAAINNGYRFDLPASLMYSSRFFLRSSYMTSGAAMTAQSARLESDVAATAFITSR